MKKTLRIIVCILLVLLIGVNVYLGRLFLSSKSENEELNNKLTEINNQISEANNQIEELNNKINDLSNSEDNKNLILEYTNWKHHLEKLEKVMDY